MGLKDIGETLPPGFRFYPSDEELVCHYLHKKIANEEALKGTLVEIDLHTCEPWQLPEVAKLNESEWYFFSFRDRKYATGLRTNRATTSGYWKATGKDRVILDPNTRRVVGMRKTLVFYRNRAPNGFKTGWTMHEFRLEAPHVPPKEDWVLCRVFHKSKGESHLFDTTSTTASPPLTMASPPPPDHIQGNTMVYGYMQGSDPFNLNPNPQTQTYNDPNSAYHSTLLSPNHLMQLLEGVNPYTSNCSFNFNDVIMMDDHHSSTNGADDDDGLLWDMGFQEINNGHLLHHHHDFGDHIYGVK